MIRARRESKNGRRTRGACGDATRSGEATEFSADNNLRAVAADLRAPRLSVSWGAGHIGRAREVCVARCDEEHVRGEDARHFGCGDGVSRCLTRDANGGERG